MVFGFGYFGVWLKYHLSDKDFKSLSSFDKTMQSFILGMISFVATTRVFQIPTETIMQQEAFTQFVIGYPTILILHTFSVVYLVFVWDAFPLGLFKKLKGG